MALTVECVELNTDGEGVAYLDGKKYVISNLLPGEKADIHVMGKTRNFYYAKVLNRLNDSPNRDRPCCSVFYSCGGCTLMHLKYIEQLQMKQHNLIQLFQTNEINTTINDIIGMKNPLSYRNKIQIPVKTSKGGKMTKGLFSVMSHNIIENKKCQTENAFGDKILDTVIEQLNKYQFMAYDAKTRLGDIKYILIKVGQFTNEVLVSLIVKHEIVLNDNFIPELIALHPEIKTITIMVSPIDSNVILSDQETVVYGNGYIVDELDGLKFQISSHSFFQVNPMQAKVLYKEAIRMADISSNDVVLDAYCGVGTISLYASRIAKKVIGVEIVESAIINANENKAINNINNVEFVLNDAQEYIKNVKEPIDIIFVDPPRKGCSEDFLKSLLSLSPKKIVYISCEPTTLVRDLKILESKYIVKEVSPVDMFPQTGHVESVVLLSQQKPNDKIEVDLYLDDLDVTSAETKATYAKIKDYVLKEHGLKVSNLYISQVKRKCGLEVGENYNLAKSEDVKQPNCPEEKEKAIREALKYFGMVS